MTKRINFRRTVLVVLTLVLICVSSLAYVPVHSQSNDLYNVIYSGLSSVSGEIDLKPLNLSTSMASDVRDTYFSILYEILNFLLNTSIKYRWLTTQ